MKLILKLLFLSTVMASFGLAQSARRIPVTLPTQVSQPEMQALLIHKVDPVYPPLAHQARVQGTVVLQIVIDKSGSVVNLQLVSGHPMLAPAAIEAVKQWKYQPYTVDGSPVEVQTQVQVNFSLSNQPIVGVIGSVASGYALPPPTPGVPRAPEVVLRTLRIEKVDPLYPPNAIRDRIQGTVVLDVRIAASGSVENVSLLSGHPVLAPAAIEAVKQWRYKPYMVNGEPGPVESTVRLNFTISENDPQGSVNESSPEPKFPSPAPVPQRVRVSAAVSQGFVLEKVPPK